MKVTWNRWLQWSNWGHENAPYSGQVERKVTLTKVGYLPTLVLVNGRRVTTFLNSYLCFRMPASSCFQEFQFLSNHAVAKSNYRLLAWRHYVCVCVDDVTVHIKYGGKPSKKLQNQVMTKTYNHSSKGYSKTLDPPSHRGCDYYSIPAWFLV